MRMTGSGTDETDSAPVNYSRRQLLSAIGGTAVVTGGGGIGIGSLLGSDSGGGLTGAGGNFYREREPRRRGGRSEGELVGAAGSRCGKLEPGADLSGCDLRGEDLSGEDLREADLTGANLEGTNLEGANLEEATWTDGSTCGTADCDGRAY